MEIRRLNTLRGIAALIVVISHFSNESGLWGKMLGEGAGQLGVMLFFMLSGFLMSYLYWESEPRPRSLLFYAVARVARVVPLYLLIVFFSFMIPNAYGIENVRILTSHLLFLHGNNVLWTIPPEVQFYVLFALCWSIVWHRRAMLPLILSFVFVSTFLLNFQSGTRVVFGFPVTISIIKAIPYFMLGCIGGGLYKHREYLSTYQSHWYLVSLVLLPLLYPNIFSVIFSFEHGMWEDVGVLAIVGIVFFCVVFLVPDRNPLLENNVGDFFGRVSYSLYLLHILILGVLEQIGWVGYGALSLFVFLALSSFMAWISFNVIEIPSRKAIRAIIDQQSGAGDVQPVTYAGHT